MLPATSFCISLTQKHILRLMHKSKKESLLIFLLQPVPEIQSLATIFLFTLVHKTQNVCLGQNDSLIQVIEEVAVLEFTVNWL